MSALIQKIKSVTKVQIIAIILIVLGLAIMIPRVMGMRDFYTEVKFAREHKFKAGDISPDLLRPWMTLRYISVAYAVPQKYLFDAIGLQPREENSMIALVRLSRNLRLGQANGELALMGIVRSAIVKYRTYPVATGLIERHVQEWMSIQYIANSTGIPAESFFQELGIPMEGNAYLPIGPLSKVVNYAGGPGALATALQKIVDSQPVAP